ncbi:MAG: hypothetical protein ACXWU9_03405 [Telluria sp.]
MGIQGFKIIARQRARLVGKMLAIEKNIIAEQSQLCALRAKIAAFDEVLREQGIDIDADAYAPAIKPTPRLHYFGHGELTVTCLNFLRTQRRPLTPVQLFEGLLVLKKPVWRNLDDPRKVRQSIKNLMKACGKRGLVVRVGNAGNAQNDPGIWALPEFALVPWDASPV